MLTLCFLALAWQPVAAGRQPTRQVGDISVSVVDPRPLATAVEQLEKRFGWVITYEDPFYLHTSDIEDVTLAVRRDGNFSKRVLAPRGGLFNFQYSVPQAGNVLDASAVLSKLLEDYQLTGHPGVFRMRRTGDVFHIVPSQTRNAAGQLESVVPFLETDISLPAGDRTSLRMVEEITSAVSNPDRGRVGVGTVPINLMMQVRVQGGARNEHARTVLLRTFNATGRTLSWALFCSPGLTPECALNIHVVEKHI
jgi:hypothetical protein